METKASCSGRFLARGGPVVEAVRMSRFAGLGADGGDGTVELTPAARWGRERRQGVDAGREPDRCTSRLKMTYLPFNN
jgi:hypothetical protein